MLWNPENDKPKVQLDETLVSLIDWLERQPKNTPYDVTDPEKCLLGQYATAMDYVCPALKSEELFYSYHKIVLPQGGGDVTFGAALDRARNHLSARRK